MTETQSDSQNVVQNDIMRVQVNNPNIQITNRFREVLNLIPQLVSTGNELLNTDIDKILDEGKEDQINQLLNDLKEPQAMVKEVKQARTNMRKLFNQQRDFFTTEFDNQLTNAQFDKLEDIDKRTKQLKRDLTSRRRTRRWNELKTTFEATLDAYPLIEMLSPKLVDFSTFKLHNPKLVTGAKTAHITDKQRAVVTNTIAKWNNDLSVLQQNAANLNEDDLASLYRDYADLYGDMTAVQNKINFYHQREEANREAQRQAELLRKQQEEAARKQKEAEQAKQQQQQAPATKPQPTAQPKPQPKPVTPPPRKRNEPSKVVESYSWLVNLILTNDNWRNNLMNPQKANRVKLEIIESILVASHTNDSPINNFTHNNPDELFGAIKYIVNNLNLN